MTAIGTGDCDDYILKASVSSKLKIPFFLSLIQAGFPSPATDYMGRVCDLNDLCVHNPEATYFVRVTGDSMTGDGIEPGDVLVVDCSRKAESGRIAVVWYNGEHTVKRIHLVNQMVMLMPSNPDYEPIYIHAGEDFKIFGVVTFNVKRML